MDCDSFEQIYRCYPLSHIEKPHLETGDKIIMPVSALDRLISIRIEYPMLFEIQNLSYGRVSHCGVLEFSGTEGLVFLPNWMMKNLQLQEGDCVKLKNAALPKGTYVKLQPHTLDFILICDPKAVLEATLRNFSCLSIGDTVMITHNSEKFYIDILETKPSSAISIIETDCEVDFAPPLDYKEPEKPKPEESAQGEPKFKPFTGAMRRLDGKPGTELAAPVPKEDQLTAVDGTRRASQSNFGSRNCPGKLVVGSDVIQPPKTKSTKLSKEDVKEETSKKEEGKFRPFTGKKYTLTG